MDIPVLPPDVNEGENEFVVTPSGIRFGLSAIKGVGESAVETIIKYRQIGGPYKNIFDFCTRVELRSVNKKTIEGLIQAGAFDTLHDDRARLFAGVEKAIQFGQASQGNAALGQDNLFGGTKETKSESYPALPEAHAWHGSETLTKEREVLGFYISGHPLRKYQREVEAFSTAMLGDGEKVRDGTTVRVCGVVVAVRKKVDKKGNTMAFLTLQDFSNKGECIVFSDAFKKCAHLLTDEACVLVMGKAEQNGDTLRIFVNEVVPLDQARQRFMKGVGLTIDTKNVGPDAILDLKKLMEKYKGRFPCVVNVISTNGGSGAGRFSMPLQVDPSDQFFAAAEKLFGPRSTRILV
jgi:DNA polymerase-3 subunit alpha